MDRIGEKKMVKKEKKYTRSELFSLSKNRNKM